MPPGHSAWCVPNVVPLRYLRPMPQARRHRFASALVFLLLLAVFGWCFIAARIAIFSRHSAAESADAALVLGAAAWGNRPSPVYRERIAQAVTLYEEHRVRWIILTGGSPVPGYPSEAQVGRRFCLSHGIPDAALVVEEHSRTTWENLLDARAQMRPRGIRSVLLVSDPLHMKRAFDMARALGLDAQPVPTATSRFRSWQSRAFFLWRETWLYLGFLLGIAD